MEKRKLYENIIVPILLIFTAVSCTKNEAPPQIPEIATIKLLATIKNNNTDVKTSLSDPNTVVWNKNDAIAVINGNKLYKFIISDNDANKAEGTFSVDKSVLPDGYVEGDFNPDMPIKAFYPYNGIIYNDISHIVNYEIPAEQINSTGKVLPMAAYAANAKEELIFNSLFGILKLKLIGKEGEIVKNLEIISSSIINGTATISINPIFGSSPEALAYISKNQTHEDGNIDCRKITLLCHKEDESISIAKDFYIALPAGAKNLRVLIHTTKASYHKYVQIENISTDTDKDIDAGTSDGTNSEQTSMIVAGRICEMPQWDTNEMMYAYLENGVYLGDGIELQKSADGNEKLIWAPVNCGYEAEKKDGYLTIYKGYPFGKLYQWGRKDGQGYNDNLYQDATYPTEIYTLGNNTAESGKFYKDWSVSSATVWPAVSDPCPDGWRVPTNEELVSLIDNFAEGDYKIGLESQWTFSNEDINSNQYGLPGFWFFGNSTNKENKLFLPAAGIREYNLGNTELRGLSGCYWSASSTQNGNAWYIDFNRRGYIDSYSTLHASGRSVRCVKAQ